MSLHHHYIFGYGSLTCAHSRALTANTASTTADTAVTVHGVERVWSKRSYTLGMTAMGIRQRASASCVGVILPVTEQDLTLFDRREKGYTRILIPFDDVSRVPFLGDEYYAHNDHKVFVEAKRKSNLHDSSIKIWAYFPQTISPPDREFPIAQSYVDTILRGCLDVGGEEFAKEFI